MKDRLKNIPINIWNDYYEDDYVPVGEEQETYIYIESDDFDCDFQKKCLEILLEYLNNLKLEGVKLWLEFYDGPKKYPELVGSEFEKMLFSRWEIKVENLTHKKREKIIDDLKFYDVHLSCDNIPLNIYSES